MVFPKDLQLDPDQVAVLKSDEIQKLFEKAEDYGILDEFSDYFWSAVSLHNPPKDDFVTKRALLWLEEYKRHLGRAYNNTKSSTIYDKYNQLEIFLQQFCLKFGLERKSQRYVLTKCHPLQDVEGGLPVKRELEIPKFLVKSKKNDGKS